MAKIAINGFGRIGMLTARVMLSKFPELEIAAINDLRKPKVLRKLFANDFIYGKFNKPLNRGACPVRGAASNGVAFLQEKDPSKLPWAKLGIDVVLECSGFFTDYDGAKKHIKAGAKKVIISAPAKSEEIPTYLLGVNASQYQGEQIISMGSCTTNATAPVLKILQENFGVANCFINTTHSYTSGQDKIYPNWRTDKASGLSIIPHTTGASKSVEKALPALQDKLAGIAFRVPTAIVSIVDIVALLEKPADASRINQALTIASQSNEMRGILQVSEKPLVSRDLIGNSYSSIVELGLTQVSAAGNIVRVMAWYDNEYGYASRLSELAEFIMSF